MGKTAFIFPGQGSQYVGMGKGLWESHREVRELYETASRETGIDIGGMTFEGPEKKLNGDLNAQLAVYVCNEACRIAASKAGIVPDAVTGYSMGFYSALVAAGSLDFVQGLQAVKAAGEHALNARKQGTMAAIIGLDAYDIEDICRKASVDGGVWISNVNAARQLLVSGSVQDVGRAVTLALEEGALSAYALPMGAAYHSPLMREAAERFMDDLQGVALRKPSIPVLSYIEARYVHDEEDIRRTVGNQLSSKVLWKDSVLSLIRDGVDNFIEVGPGSALTRMVRWIDREVKAAPVETLLFAAG